MWSLEFWCLCGADFWKLWQPVAVNGFLLPDVLQISQYIFSSTSFNHLYSYSQAGKKRLFSSQAVWNPTNPLVCFS